MRSIDVSGFAAGWEFLGRSGLSTLGSPWSAISPLPSSPVYAFIQGSTGSMSQIFETGVSGPHLISFSVQSNWWPSGKQTFHVLIDDRLVYDTRWIDPNHWVRRSFTVTLPAGMHLIRFMGMDPDANETGYIDSVQIENPSGNLISLANGNMDSYSLAPGKLVYNPPAVASPGYWLEAAILVGGGVMECSLVSFADDSTVPIDRINEPPVLSINGVPVGPLVISETVTTSVHASWLVPLPGYVRVKSTDVLTLSAPEGWAFVPSGYTEAMNEQVVTNFVGRSPRPDADLPNTVEIGVAISHQTTPEWRNGFFPKNQVKRCAYWNPSQGVDSAGKPVYIKLNPGGYPLRLVSSPSIAPIVAVGESNGIDGTGYPTPEGDWLVRYEEVGDDVLKLTSNEDINGIIEEGETWVTGGIRHRVFSCRRKGSVTNFQVWLILWKPDLLPQFQELAVLAPGDHDYVKTKRVFAPMPEWHEVAACVKAKVPEELPFTCYRFATNGTRLGESAACEREHVVAPEDFRWAQDVKTVLNMRYIQAKPWIPERSPWIYDPISGQPYQCTLVADVPVAPAMSNTVVYVKDAARVPIMAGLVLRSNGEDMRVDKVDGDAVSVTRAVASSIPAAHVAGPVDILGRRPIGTLADWGISNMQVTELVTESPHGVKSGQILVLDGTPDGWPPFVYTDGRGFRGTWFRAYYMPTYVTGPNSFVVLNFGGPPSNPLNTTLDRAYDLDPSKCWTTHYLPEYGGNPYELSPACAAKHPGGAGFLSFPLAASLDMVDAIWRGALEYLPADRGCKFETGNEPWNFAGSASAWWNPMDWQIFKRSGNNVYWYAYLNGIIRGRGRAIWEAAGRDPSLIQSHLNMQTVAGGAVPGILDFCKANDCIPDDIAIAPYYDIYTHESIAKAYGLWDADMLSDLYAWDFRENRSPESQYAKLSSFRGSLDSWNFKNGGSVGLIIYEYGPGYAWPLFESTLAAAMDETTRTLVLSAGDATNVQRGTWLICGSEWMKVASRSGLACEVDRGVGGTVAAPHPIHSYVRSDWVEGTRDVTLDPTQVVYHQDSLRMFREYGVKLCIPSCLDQAWTGGAGWADYHGIDQKPGTGDGLNGETNNRHCLARRGQPFSKAPTMNLEVNTVSPRGLALIRWVTPAVKPLVKRETVFIARPRLSGSRR